MNTNSPAVPSCFFAFLALSVERRGQREPAGPGPGAGGLEGIRGLATG